MYIRGIFNGVPVIKLVDTGATVTLLKRNYDVVTLHNNLEFYERQQESPSASGTLLRVYGKTLVQFKFGDKIIVQNVVAADMKVDAVLVQTA